MANKHIIYDTETTGADVRFDQILQFAAALYDDDFVVQDSFDERSRLLPHVVPHPVALRVTEIDPNTIAQAPHSPYEYAHHIHGRLSEWKQSAGRDGVAGFEGFNTINFDEEITRQMFWQNMINPYLTSGKGTSRVDYMIMARALYARNPEAMNFPVLENGKTSFKLENLAPANGFEGHDAHDALGDVYATAHVARLMRDTDPALFEHIFKMGNSTEANRFVDQHPNYRVLGGAFVNPGVLDVATITSDPQNPKAKVAWNLAVDPKEYFDMSQEDILKAMRKSGTPFRNVKTNKMSAIFPENWEFLNHASGTEAPSRSVIVARTRAIQENVEFQMRVQAALSQKVAEYEPNEHLEQKIYDGFPSRDDENKMKSFRNSQSWNEKHAIASTFDKRELRLLGLRLVYSESPENLPAHQKKMFDEALEKGQLGLTLKHHTTTVGTAMKDLDELMIEQPEYADQWERTKAWMLKTYPSAQRWDAEKEQLLQKLDDDKKPKQNDQETSENTTQKMENTVKASDQKQQDGQPMEQTSKTRKPKTEHHLDWL